MTTGKICFNHAVIMHSHNAMQYCCCRL